MDIMLVFNQMIIMLILLAVGVIAARTGVVDDDTNRRMTRFTMAVPQCAITVSSAMNMEMDMTAGKVLGILGIGCVMYALLIVLGLLTPVIGRVKSADRGVYSFLTIFGNVAFMGYPLVRALFGNDAVVYAALLCMPFNLLAFTVGIGMIRGGAMGRLDRNVLINPPLVASVTAVVIIFLHIDWPGPVAGAAASLGDMVMPFSMIIIGASLGEQKLRDVFANWRTYVFAPVKLIVAPVLLWAVMRLFVKDALLLNTLTVLGAMPSAAIAAMLSIQYGGNERLASRVVFLTTVLSVVTIPAICWLLL